jgi:hypothetical protein
MLKFWQIVFAERRKIGGPKSRLSMSGGYKSRAPPPRLPPPPPPPSNQLHAYSLPFPSVCLQEFANYVLKGYCREIKNGWL